MIERIQKNSGSEDLQRGRREMTPRWQEDFDPDQTSCVMNSVPPILLVCRDKTRTRTTRAHLETTNLPRQLPKFVLANLNDPSIQAHIVLRFKGNNPISSYRILNFLPAEKGKKKKNRTKFEMKERSEE
jgi:hypothetical protein